MCRYWSSNGATGEGNSRAKHSQGTPKTAVNGGAFLVGSLGGRCDSARKALAEERKEHRRSTDRAQLAQNASTTNKIPSSNGAVSTRFVPNQATVSTRCVITKWPLNCIGARALPHSLCATHTLFSQLLRLSTMDSANSKWQKRQENIFSSLDVAIKALNLAKDVCGIPPAQAVFASVSILLTMIRVRFPLFSDDLFRVDT